MLADGYVVALVRPAVRTRLAWVVGESLRPGQWTTCRGDGTDQ